MKNYAGRTALGEARINNNKNIVALIQQKYIAEKDILDKKLASGGEEALKAAIAAAKEKKKREELEQRMANRPERDAVAWLQALKVSLSFLRFFVPLSPPFFAHSLPSIRLSIYLYLFKLPLYLISF